MSMNTSVSGLKAASESLSIISNNIANANTIGYKAMDVQFADVYSQASAGGGVYVSNIDTNFSQGNTVYTTSATDLAIDGNGFFITRDANGQDYYTRAGNFTTDKDGFLVNAQDMKVMGFGVDQNGNVIEGQLTDLQINNADMKAKESGQMTLVANLDARSEVPVNTPFNAGDTSTYNSTTTTTVYDSLGEEHQVSLYYVKTGDNQWQVHATIPNNNPNLPAEDITSQLRSNTVSFNKDGSVSAPSFLEFKTPGVDFKNGSEAMMLSADISGMTQFGNDFSVTTNTQNGYAAGNFYGISIGKDGAIVATYSNGQSQVQGYVPLAIFPNESALAAAGNTSWSANVESGEAIIGLPGSGKSGTLEGGAQENSNVDMSMELVDMIVSQSAYQANTKSISTFNDNMSMLINTI